MFKRLLAFAVIATLTFNIAPVVQAIPNETNQTNEEITDDEYVQLNSQIHETEIRRDGYGFLVAAPDKLLVNEEKTDYNDNPFCIDVSMWNNSNTVFTNLKVEIILPEGLDIVANQFGFEQNPVIEFPFIGSLGYWVDLGWDIKAAPQIKDTTLYYTIKITADNMDEEEIKLPINLPKVRNDELIIEVPNSKYLLLNEEKSDYEDNPFKVDVNIQNNTYEVANNIKVEILPEEGLCIQGNQGAVRDLGDIAIGEEKNISWDVRAKLQETDTVIYCTIKVTKGNNDYKEFTIPINLPGKGKDNVYIVLPGIMGSELYAQDDSGKTGITDLHGEYKGNGYRFWLFNYLPDNFIIPPTLLLPHPPGVVDDIAIIEMIRESKNNAIRDVSNLECDDNGYSKNQISVDGVNDSIYGNDGEYGTHKIYTEIVNELSDEFGEDNVKFFPYDWRMSIESAAEKLKNFIDENNYKNINIVAHSMGGVVACEYIKMVDEERKDDIKLITLGTPYLGAPTALYRMETGNALENNDFNPIDEGIEGYNLLFLRNSFKTVMPNIRGIYELFPTRDYFTYKNQDTYYVKRYDKVRKWYQLNKPKWSKNDLNYLETKALITDRSWGNGDLIKGSENTHNQLTVLDVFNSVDSYAVIGYNKDTTMRVDEYFNLDGSFDKTKKGLKLKGGDGTVPIVSATIGGKISEDRDFYVEEKHGKLPKNEDVINFVCTKLKNWDSTDYNNIYGSLSQDIYSSSWGKIKIEKILSEDEIVPKGLNYEEEDISFPSIKVHSPKGELIVEINDYKLEGEINDYGSFDISDDGDEIILSLDVPESGNYKVEVSGEGTYDVEMVQGEYSTDEEGNLDLDKYLAGNVIETELYKGTIENYELKGQDLITVNFGKDGDYVANLDKGSNGELDEQINIKKALEGVLSDNIEPSIELNIDEKNKNKSIVSIKANDDVSIDTIMYIIYNPEKEDELSANPQIIYENTKNEVCKEVELEDIYTFKNKNDGEIMKIVAIDMNGNVIEAEYAHHKKAGNEKKNN